MEYKEYLPTYNAASVVKCYWTLKGHSQNFHEVLPDGSMDVIFNFSGPLVGKMANGVALNKSGAFVVGNMTKPILSGAGEGGFNLLGIRFKTAGIYPLLKQPLNSFTDLSVDLKSISNGLYETFAGINDLRNDNIQSLDNVLSAIGPIPDKRILYAISLIQQCHGAVKISELAQKVCLSAKQLERLFLKYVGISPKLYADTEKFTMLNHLLQEPIPRLDLIEKLGFYDNSHMHRFYQRFSNKSPL